MAAAMNPGRLLVLGTLLGGCLLALPVIAASLPPLAYRWATQGTPVPPQVLYALALQESGTLLRGRLRPWPWTLNVAGLPYRYADRQSACNALLLAIEQVGAKRVDAGLGQINLGWNGEHFAHPCQALDPYRNLSVAAGLLLEHKTPEVDWVTAAGRYHRPVGGAPAERYRKAFAHHLARVTHGPVQGRHTR
ncbi:lytic transglycosylase domain-containing protein [Pseudomonas gingeri]|uniref:lytic transglycosylase domain-containing protein n=1 Tax=Pseudomonas gingeri TaxID=117681 RepID=UPI003F750D86